MLHYIQYTPVAPGYYLNTMLSDVHCKTFPIGPIEWMTKKCTSKTAQEMESSCKQQEKIWDVTSGMMVHPEPLWPSLDQSLRKQMKKDENESNNE